MGKPSQKPKRPITLKGGHELVAPKEPGKESACPFPDEELDIEGMEEEEEEEERQEEAFFWSDSFCFRM